MILRDEADIVDLVLEGVGAAMAGIPGEQPAAGHAAGAARIDDDELLARRDDVELRHVLRILGMSAAAVEDEDNRRRLAAREVADEIAALATVVLEL